MAYFLKSRTAALILFLALVRVTCAPALDRPRTPDPELADCIAKALGGDDDALERFGAYLDARVPDPGQPADALAGLPRPDDPEERKALAGLAAAHRIAAQAVDYARSRLGDPDFDAERFTRLREDVDADPDIGPDLRRQAAKRIEAAREEATRLQALRTDVFEQLLDEARRGRGLSGTRSAWTLLRLGVGMPDVRLDPASLRFDEDNAQMELAAGGMKARIRIEPGDIQTRFRAEVGGYTFVSGWTVLAQKPFAWMLSLARAMRAAGVPADLHAEWFVMEAPEGLVALSPAGDGGLRKGVPERAFFRGELRDVVPLPEPPHTADLNDAFRKAARTLHQGVMADDRIPAQLRQALRPILEGAYLPVDPRDYFDNEFCRRLIEADYLEAHIEPLPPERAGELAAYRAALGKLEAGVDRFAVPLGGGGRLVAVAGMDLLSSEGDGPLLDSETGEVLPPFEWRLEADGETAFHSPLPARYLYALSLVERYAGTHRVRPEGVPDTVEVWHALLGRIASYRAGAAAAEGREEDWLAAVTLDCRGRIDTTGGPLGWNFPFHVLQRDGQGDPVRLATRRGVVDSPDFSALADAGQRRLAEDGWLDHAAAVLAQPGELGLIYHHFFRYCSDSPLPELPNLIGSHYGLSDTHQTVHQSLERRWVGRLIGDCDDLAEFFQVLTEKQGRLSHVMQVPAHAACGFVEKTPEGEFRFVVLQTGPVLQFTAPTLYEAVERAYRSFDNDRGTSQITDAAVPILLRFADEETRTAFVLPVRIYEDKDYAEAMFTVQEYWHLHAFSAGIGVMEEMVREDRTVGNLRELASLYEQVGDYEKAAGLRREEIALTGDDADARIAAMLELAYLHCKSKDGKAAAALGDLGTAFQKLRDDDPDAHDRLASFRSTWAVLQARYGDPVPAWEMYLPEIAEALENGVRLPEYTLGTLVSIYEFMAFRAAGGGEDADSGHAEARTTMEAVLDASFAEGFFRDDDSYNQIMGRYGLLGHYAVAAEDRRQGLRLLAWDGPYPDGPRDHEARRRALSGVDWEWLRINPDLYFALALGMLDADDNPERYDPATARVMLEAVSRAVGKGTGLGADVVGAEALVKARLVLSFLDGDLEGFRSAMALVREKNYSSLYDDAAQAFGNHCGLVRIGDFPAWIEALPESLPGRQHYFKMVYRALDREFFDHALLLAEAARSIFPDDPLLAAEADYVVGIVPGLREGKERREAGAGHSSR